MNTTVAPSVLETLACPQVPDDVAVTDNPALIDLTDSLDMVLEAAVEDFTPTTLQQAVEFSSRRLTGPEYHITNHVPLR